MPTALVKEEQAELNLKLTVPFLGAAIKALPALLLTGII